MTTAPRTRHALALLCLCTSAPAALAADRTVRLRGAPAGAPASRRLDGGLFAAARGRNNESCDEAPSKKQCMKAGDRCEWNARKEECREAPLQCSETSKKQCKKSAGCEWDADDEACLEIAQNNPSEGSESSESSESSSPDETSSEGPCAAAATKKRCGKDDRCEWDGGEDACVAKSCPGVATKKQCLKERRCKWDARDGGSCLDAPQCPSRMSKKQCTKARECRWDVRKGCRVRAVGSAPPPSPPTPRPTPPPAPSAPEECADHSTQKHCKKSGCQWEEEKERCSEKCIDLDKKRCQKKEKACRWERDGDRCVAADERRGIFAEAPAPGGPSD